MKTFKSGITAFLVIALILTMTMLFTGQMNRLWNPQVQGFLYGKDAQFAGERTWGTTGTLDTLVVTGVDITCTVYLTPKTATGTLRYDVATAGDTVFVTSSGSETAATDKYSYLVIKNGYNASD
jgi:hypothetical protein